MGIKYLWEYPEVADRMGQEGRRIIEQNHTIEGFVNMMKEIVVEAAVEEGELKQYPVPQPVTDPILKYQEMDEDARQAGSMSWSRRIPVSSMTNAVSTGAYSRKRTTGYSFHTPVS